MDEVTSKLKKLFKSKPKGFKGSGHRLGSDAQASAPAAPPSRTQQQQQSYRPQPAAPEKPSPSVPKQPLGLRSVPPTERADVPPASVVTTGAYIAPDEQEATPQQKEAYALLKPAPQRAAAAEVLTKVLRNIVDHPTDAKYRKLKLNNKKVQQTVVNVDGALELLQASGFELVFEEVSPEPETAHVSAAASNAAVTHQDGQPAAVSSQAESGTTGYLWFPEDAELWVLQAALQLLRPLTPLPFSKPSTGSNSSSQPQASASQSLAAQSSSSSLGSNATSGRASLQDNATSSSLGTGQGPNTTAALGKEREQQQSAQSGSTAAAPVNLALPRDRKTRVLLPSETDAQVPDYVFQQSAAELKQAFMKAKKKREMDSMLMTRAYREKLAGGKTQKGTYIYAVIRVRLPEGLLLQGEFNAREPVSTIFEWVSDSLRDPASTYELILPSRKPLITSMGRISDADLLPSALLNLRFDGPSACQKLPSLHDDLLQRVE